MKIPDLRVVNVIYASKFPFKRKLNLEEITSLVNLNDDKINFSFHNERNGGIISVKIKREDSDKFANVLLWLSGAISINGVKTEEEAKKDLKLVLNELKELTDIF